MQIAHCKTRFSRSAAMRVAALVLMAAAGACLVVPIPARAQDDGPRSVAPIAKKLLSSVVNISTTQTLKGPQGVPLPQVPEGSPFDEFFKDLFNRNGRSDRQRRVSSLGSGFVIDPSGLIVTNNHVIADADEIEINLSDGTRLKVQEVIGRDTKTDLALLRVTPKEPLPSVRFGDSGSMEVGDWVMAIGNPFGLGGSVTLGIISAKKRDINSGPYDEFLQTDAAINKGNSGGPLFNMKGEVIGVNTAIISPTGGSIGIGFAVPSNAALSIINQLREFGETRRGWLGVRVQTISDEIARDRGLDSARGALIARVAPDGPGAKAGIKEGDIVLKFDGRDVPDMRTLPRLVAESKIGSKVAIEILRDGKNQTLEIEVGLLAEDTNQPDNSTSNEQSMGEEDTSVVLGMTVQNLNDELRDEYGIAPDVEGVVITDLAMDGEAAKKGIEVGQVIFEVTQAKVRTASELLARIVELEASGKTTVLVGVRNAQGDVKMISLPTSPKQ